MATYGIDLNGSNQYIVLPKAALSERFNITLTATRGNITVGKYVLSLYDDVSSTNRIAIRDNGGVISDSYTPDNIGGTYTKDVKETHRYEFDTVIKTITHYVDGVLAGSTAFTMPSTARDYFIAIGAYIQVDGGTVTGHAPNLIHSIDIEDIDTPANSRSFDFNEGTGDGTGNGYTIVGYVDDTIWVQTSVSTDVAATHASINVTTYQATVTSGSNTDISASHASVNVVPFQATVTHAIPANISASHASVNVTAYAATVTHNADASITTEPLKNNTGTLLSSQTGITVNVYNRTTGALVVRKTGETTDASGVLTFSDASLSAGTTYYVHIEIGSADGGARIQAA